jgi:DNA-directed RNA polymerase subunit RPC12/RpoP
MTVKIVTILGAISVTILLFFSLIFAIASSYNPQRLVTSLMLFIVALALAALIYYTTRKPKTVIQRLEVSGQMKTVGLKCPNCSASVDANQIRIVQGVPYATCPYCGTTFEVAEEPKW